MSEATKHSGLPARKGTREALLWGGLFFFIVALATLPSVLIAWVAHWKGPRLSRVENGLIVAGAMIIFFIDAGPILVDQPKWLATVATLLHGSAWPLPWLSIITTAAFFYGIAGLTRSTEAATKVHGRVRHAIKTARNPLATTSLIPKANTKAQVKIPAIPGGVVPVSAAQHTAQYGATTSRSFSIGVDHQGRPFPISEDEIAMHGVILGSTGSGKTVTIKSLSAALMDLGWDGMILDLKEDIAPGGLRDFCSQYAATHSLAYQHLALSEATSEYWLNPLEGMDADYARDTILSLTPFDDHYWQNINKKMLGQLINLCYDAHAIDPANAPYPTIYGIGEILEKGNLASATKRLRALVAGAKPNYASRYTALASPEPDAQKSASGFGAKLTQMYDTIAGRTVLREGDGRKDLDVTKGGLVYIGLDSTGKPDLSILVSSALLQRMSVFAAQRTTGLASKGKRRFLIIDEASVVNRGILKALLSKARSAGVVVIVCTQGPDDWMDEDGDDWSEMTQNINVAIVMSQGSSRSAEICAEYLGQKTTLQSSLTTEQGERTERATVRESVEFIVQPHELRALEIGESIIRVGKPRERVSWMAIRERDANTRANVGVLHD